ncbi:MAG: BNR-4 repeat-containing protein [Verrucomicrobiota bacterium]|jgi:hypothetical protein
MKTNIFNLTAILATLTSVLTGLAVSSHAASVTLEAESGTLGTNFAVLTDGAIQYITNTNNNTAYNPGIPGRVVTYSVTFPEPGTYELYARLRVGPGNYNDDSMFYARGFGSKSPALDSDWVMANGLAGAGFTDPNDVVTGGGTVGNNIWKWINLSQFAPGPTFAVTATNLTQTFQIGGREDGLDIDKLVFGTSGYTFTVTELETGGDGVPPLPPPVFSDPSDQVNGNLIQFNDNGAWCWYQDERAVVDKTGGKLIVGSDACGYGVGGPARDGEINAVIFDLGTGSVQRSVLLPSGGHGFICDDHDAPAFVVRPDGKYLAVYAGHNTDYFSYFRIFNGTDWGTETSFDWTSIRSTDPASYSNPHYLSAEGRIYNMTRCNDNKSPNILVSTDYGDTWSFYGQLVHPDGVVGYNSGYFRYCDNGVDRIDFICTEAHPRDVLTSIYHGYISNNMSFRSDGTVVDTNLNDTNCPVSRNFTPVFTNGTVLPPGQTNYRCWNSDVQRYPDGTIECIIHARINQSASGGYPDTVNPNHAFFFCRYDGTNWTPTYLCQAGYKMYSDEADYVGLGCLSPNDPNTIYISTYYDPRAVQPGVFDTNQPYSSFREIWKGVTTNHGASFTWTPITQHSVCDNFRPLVPTWDANNTALLWWRGYYAAAQMFDAAVVGIVEHRSEVVEQMTYVDATTTNTFFAATGEPLTVGPASGQWHERTGSGNGGSVLASADVDAEDAPTLKTTVTVPAAGTYDVWANFWADPSMDWRIMAGLSTNGMRLFRQMPSKEVRAGDHNASLVLTNRAASGTNYLYQAYVGRVVASSSNTISVFVDDNDIIAGTVDTTIGDFLRTWYDGISYARVNPFQITGATYNPGGSMTLTWNSVRPEASLTTPVYTVQKKNSLDETNWTTVATGIASGGFSTTNIDNSASGSTAFYRVTWP